SIILPSTAFISGRCKSVIMRSGGSAKALFIPCAKFPACEVSYPASFRQKARSCDKSGLSSNMSIFCVIDRPFRAIPRLGLFLAIVQAMVCRRTSEFSAKTRQRSCRCRVVVIFRVGEVNRRGYVCEDRSGLPSLIHFCANDRPAFLAS